MCDTITLQCGEETAEYEPSTHTCTCELQETPKAPADPLALQEFAAWVLKRYRLFRLSSGEYDPRVELTIR